MSSPEIITTDRDEIYCCAYNAACKRLEQKSIPVKELQEDCRHIAEGLCDVLFMEGQDEE